MAFDVNAASKEILTKEQYDEIMKIAAQSNVPLIAAAKKGDFETIKELLNAGEDINVKDIAENTPLLAAVAGGRVEVVKMLLDMGADLKAEAVDRVCLVKEKEMECSRYNYSPLYLAVMFDNIQIAKLLLDKGADVNVYCDKLQETPLMKAAANKSTEMVKLLLANGADLSLKNEYGKSVIEYALDDMDELVGKQSGWARLNALGMMLQKYEQEGLSEAEIAEKIRFGDDPFKNMEKNIEDILIMLIEAGADVNGESEYGDTPLYNSISSGDVEAVKLLLKHGAGVDINKKYEDDNTLLIEAAKRPYDEGTEIVKMLLDAGADVNVQNKDGETPLINTMHTSSSEGCNISSMKLLLDAGADVNFIPSSFSKKSALYDAYIFCYSIYKDPKPLYLLLERGGDINIKDANGDTVLMGALSDSVQPVQPEDIKMLLDRGADVNVRNNDGVSPLRYAEEHCTKEIVKILIDAGARY